MSRYALSVTFDPTKTDARTRATWMHVWKGRLDTSDRQAAVATAGEISLIYGVQRVTLTRLEEHSEGVWRNGRKS